MGVQQTDRMDASQYELNIQDAKCTVWPVTLWTERDSSNSTGLHELISSFTFLAIINRS